MTWMTSSAPTRCCGSGVRASGGFVRREPRQNGAVGVNSDLGELVDVVLQRDAGRVPVLGQDSTIRIQICTQGWCIRSRAQTSSGRGP
jgi:hypothetical protein